MRNTSSDGRGCGAGEAVPLDTVPNPPPGEGMRESSCLELLKAEEKAWWIQMRDDCPRTTGQLEACREDARIGCLEGGGPGFLCAWGDVHVVEYRRGRRHMENTGYCQWSCERRRRFFRRDRRGGGDGF